MPEEKKNTPLGFDLGLDSQSEDPFELLNSPAGQAFLKENSPGKTRARDGRSTRGKNKGRRPTAGKDTVAISAYLKPELHKALKIMAMTENMAQKDLIAELLAEAIKARKNRDS